MQSSTCAGRSTSACVRSIVRCSVPHCRTLASVTPGRKAGPWTAARRRWQITFHGSAVVCILCSDFAANGAEAGSQLSSVHTLQCSFDVHACGARLDMAVAAGPVLTSALTSKSDRHRAGCAAGHGPTAEHAGSRALSEGPAARKRDVRREGRGPGWISAATPLLRHVQAGS